MGENKKNNISKTLIVFILCIIASIWFLSAYKDGINLTNNNTKKYSSLNELMNDTTLEIKLPEFIESEENLNIETKIGKLVQINNNNFVIKITDFVNNMADPLGLYDTSNIDNLYTVDSENTNIKFFRYRVGYKEYKNCTIINWCTDSTAYGLMIEKSIDQEDALNMLELSKSSLSEYIEESYDNTNELKDNTGEYTIYIK